MNQELGRAASVAEKDPSSDKDGLFQLRRVGRWMGRLVNSGDTRSLDDKIRNARAIAKQTQNPHYPYPDAIRAGGAAYGSSLPFAADWRKLLPEGDPDRPTDPSEFITHDDPEYREVLRLLCQVPIDGVNNTGRRSY